MRWKHGQGQELTKEYIEKNERKRKEIIIKPKNYKKEARLQQGFDLKSILNHRTCKKDKHKDKRKNISRKRERQRKVIIIKH